MYSHILVTTDGSKLSLDAASNAMELARLCKAKMTALLVSPTYHFNNQEGFVSPRVNIIRERYEDARNALAKTVLERVCDEAKKSGVACEAIHVFDDAPYEAIIATADQKGCDVIAMGSHGYGGVKQFFIGSETTRVLSHTKIPVMVYR